MTGFSMRCLKSGSWRNLHKAVTALIPGLLAMCLGMVLHIASAQAQSVELTHLSADTAEEGPYLDADIRLSLNSRLTDAVERGIALYFVAEAELRQTRWWWFDNVVVHREAHWRLSYNALTRQYRVANGPLALPFSQLDEALAIMTRMRRWQLAERTALTPGTPYQGRFRFRLDLSLLPQPFQVNALNSRDWNLSTDWQDFVYRSPAIETPDAEAPR